MPSLQSGCCQFTKQYCHPKIANAIAVAPGVRRFRLRYIYLRVPKRCIVSGMINGSASNYFPYDIHRTHTPSQRTIRKNRFPVRVGVQRDCGSWFPASTSFPGKLISAIRKFTAQLISAVAVWLVLFIVRDDGRPEIKSGT